ncbi:MAG: hypothetical protein WA154_09295 [Moraxellaceae bacterium]
MEIAIPLLALGGFYVISKQTHKKTTAPEGFTDNRYSLSPSDFPPTAANSTAAMPVPDSVRAYSDPNEGVGDYLNQNLYETRAAAGDRELGTIIQDVYSVDTDYKTSDQYKHSNMVPDYGRKPRGQLYDLNRAESILDNMTGGASQVIRKIEQAPLFKPEENVQYTFGAPNSSDFYQSRVNPALRNNMVKPFDSIHVGPALGQGYTAEGHGGFNSGMECRDQWKDYTVDQLRTANNPKLSYTLAGLEGPAEGFVKNRGIEGKVDKNRPDTFFVNSQDRWFTTTGVEKGQTLRPIQEMGIVKRADCDVNYSGPAISDRKGPLTPSTYEASRRNVLKPLDVTPSQRVGKGPLEDLTLDSMTNRHTNRSTTESTSMFGSGFSGAIGAVLAPITDMLRPTRKEEAGVRCVGQDGTIGRAVNASYVPPEGSARKTLKESTLYTPDAYIGSSGGTDMNTYLPSNPTQRQSTECSYMGGLGGVNEYAPLDETMYKNQHNNSKKEPTEGYYATGGGTALFNNNVNVGISRKDSNPMDCRMPPPKSLFATSASKQMIGQYQTRDHGYEIGSHIDPSIMDQLRTNPFVINNRNGPCA